MLPKLVHLIWLGEDSSGIATTAVEHWQKMSSGREVILHRDAAALLPEWQGVWPLAKNASMQSDLLRWSLLLTQGGWYFDCDVRSRLTLDEIEADCQLDPSRCFVTLFGSLATTPVSDILACRPDWIGRQAVIDYVCSQLDNTRVHNWSFAGDMLTVLSREHREWFQPAPPDRYSLLTAIKGDYVFTRGGQMSDFPKRRQAEQNACMDVCRTCEHSAPPFGYCDLLSECSRGPRYLTMLRSGDCPEDKWPVQVSEHNPQPAVQPTDEARSHRGPFARANTAEQERRKAICHACEDWTREDPAGCRFMKLCDRRDVWVMDARWRTAGATCLRTCSGLPNKWEEPEKPKE
jgi:hypothetical protein